MIAIKFKSFDNLASIIPLARLAFNVFDVIVAASSFGFSNEPAFAFSN